MKIYVICVVRSASLEDIQKLENYVQELEDQGHQVHLPHRDTEQDARGYDICMQNYDAICWADEIHVFYNSKSQGTHFDLGMTFALGKKVTIIENESYDEGKSFARMLDEWIIEQEVAKQKYRSKNDID